MAASDDDDVDTTTTSTTRHLSSAGVIIAAAAPPVISSGGSTTTTSSSLCRIVEKPPASSGDGSSIIISLMMDAEDGSNGGDDDGEPLFVPRSLDDFLEVAAAAARSTTTTTTSMQVLEDSLGEEAVNSFYLSYHSDEGSSSSTNNRGGQTPTQIVINNKNKKYPWRYWWIFLSLGVANSSDASEILCLSYILSDQEAGFAQHILRHTAWRGGLLAATVFAGMLLGGLLVGCLGDWWGRRPMLLTGLTVNCCAGVLSAVAIDVYTLSICRFVAGIGIGATVPPLFALCSELAPPSARGFWVTVAASFWMVGSIYVAVVGWVLLGLSHSSGWRIFVAACALPSFLGCVLVKRCVPESPRFLLLQGRHDQALVVVSKLADTMEYSGPLLTRDELLHHYPVPDGPTVTQTSVPSRNAGRVEEDVSNGGGLIVAGWEERASPPSFSSSFSQRRTASESLSKLTYAIRTAFQDFIISTSLLYTPQLRSTTWPLQMVWFSLSFGSYGLMTWINTLFFKVHLENVYFNALLFAFSNLPGNLMSAFLMDKTGRASLLTGSVLAAALSLVAFAYVAAAQNNDDDNAETTTTISAAWIVVAACAFQCFTIAAWNAIDVLTSELFPTSVRSTGMGVCAATGRIGAMLAQFVNGALVAKPVRLLLTAATALLLGSLTPILLPADQTGQPVQDYATSTTTTAVALRNSDDDEEAVRAISVSSSVAEEKKQRVSDKQQGVYQRVQQR